MADEKLYAEKEFQTSECSIEVTLGGKTFDPNKATEILSLTPTRTGLEGEVRETSQCGAKWDTNFWSYESSGHDGLNECRDHRLTCMIESIEPHIAALKEAGMEHIKFYYTLSSFIGLLNIRLKPETMGKLSEIGADLYISCYDCFDPKHSFWKDAVAKNG